MSQEDLGEIPKTIMTYKNLPNITAEMTVMDKKLIENLLNSSCDKLADHDSNLNEIRPHEGFLWNILKLLKQIGDKTNMKTPHTSRKMFYQNFLQPKESGSRLNQSSVSLVNMSPIPFLLKLEAPFLISKEGFLTMVSDEWYTLALPYSLIGIEDVEIFVIVNQFGKWYLTDECVLLWNSTINSVDIKFWQTINTAVKFVIYAGGNPAFISCTINVNSTKIIDNNFTIKKAEGHAAIGMVPYIKKYAIKVEHIVKPGLFYTGTHLEKPFTTNSYINTRLGSIDHKCKKVQLKTTLFSTNCPMLRAQHGMDITKIYLHSSLEHPKFLT
jgi:hypothetical protein